MTTKQHPTQDLKVQRREHALDTNVQWNSLDDQLN